MDNATQGRTEGLPPINPKYLDVSPIRKGRRMLLYFADLFLNFVLAVVFFSVAVYPIARHVTDYDGTAERCYQLQCRMMDVLYDNGLLVPDDEDKYDFTASFSLTAEVFVKSFLPEQDRRDFISYFYVDLLGQDQSVANAVYTQNASRYFTVESGIPELLPEYQEAFLPLLDSLDTMSDDAKDNYDNLTQSVFPQMYASLFTDLEESPWIPEDSPLYAYRLYRAQAQENEESQWLAVTYSVYIAMTLSCLVYFLIIPLVSKRGKTIGMMAMRIERIGSNSFHACSRLERVLIFPLQSVPSLATAMFVPIMYIDFITLFALPQLPYLSLITLAYAVVSFFFILFDKLHRSLNDFLTRTVLIDNAMLEGIYLAKGYPL